MDRAGDVVSHVDGQVRFGNPPCFPVLGVRSTSLDLDHDLPGSGLGYGSVSDLNCGAVVDYCFLHYESDSEYGDGW